MSNVLIEKNKLDVLATAIANKSGEPLKLTLAEMVEAVDGIETGGGITPTGNIDITGAGVTDVTNYATATVASASPYIYYGVQYITQNGVRLYQVRGAVGVDNEGADPGYIDYGNYFGQWYTYDAIPQNTTVTPTESAQTIGGANTMMEGAVTVNAIPSTYVGSGVTQRSSSDLTASGASVTVPSGYYSAQASKTVASGTATAPTTISGTSATVSTGTNTLTLSKTVSVTPRITTAGYVSAGTAGNSAVSLTANVTTKAAATITPTTTNQTISSGTYLTGTQTISGDANLIAGNIKSGTTIFGVTGTYSGGGGSSMNVQIAQSTNRATSSTYTNVISLTCATAGKYDIYWDCFRSSTGGTNGSQLYIGGQAYGTANTAFTNHIQNNHLTNVTLQANQTVAVYARSRGNNYYAYVGTLIIKQTS